MPRAVGILEFLIGKVMHRYLYKVPFDQGSSIRRALHRSGFIFAHDSSLVNITTEILL